MTILSEIVKVSKSFRTVKRSPQWPKVRDEHLKNNPTCAACGGTNKLEVHHIHPFSNDPELELDPTNFITLCESASKGIICHQSIGHCGSYKLYNPNVVEDAKRFKEMLLNAKD